MKDFKRKVITSLSWTVASQGATEFLQFIITIILARLLTPKDYGLVGMSSSFLVFIQNFAHLGFWAPLIQIDNIQKNQRSTGFWSMVAFSIVLFVLTYICAPFVANFFNEELLTNIIRISAISFIFISLNTVPMATLSRALKYDKIAIIEITRKIVIGCVGIGLAVNGYGVWSLVFAGLMGNVFVIPLVWWFARWWPTLSFDKSAFKELYQFGAKITVGGFISLVNRNLDNIIIGKSLGASALGYYSLAYGLMLKPLQYINIAIGRVFFPAFSYIKNDTDRIKNAYIKMIQGLSIVIFPMMTGMLFVASIFIEVVYGSKWLPATPVLQVLCIVGAIQSIGGTTGSIFLSLGRPDLDLKFKLISCPVFIVAFIAGAQYNIIGVAIAYAIANLALWVWPLYAANKLIHLPFLLFFKQLIPSIEASIGMLVVLVFVRYLSYYAMQWRITPAISLLWYISLGIASYVIIFFTFEKATAKEMIFEVKSFFKRPTFNNSTNPHR